MQERAGRRHLLAEQAKRHQHDGLEGADHAQDQQLREEVGAARQAGRPFSGIDRAFLDQFPDRVGRPDEAGGDHEDQQHGLGVGVAPSGEPLRRGHEPGQDAEDDRHHRQHGQVTPVGRDDRQVAAAQGAELGQPVARRGRLDRCPRVRSGRCGRGHLGDDVALAVGRAPVVARPVAVRLGVECLEDLRPAGLAEVPQAVLRRPEEGDLASWHQDEQPVAEVQVRHAVGDHDDGPAVVRQLGHLLHDRLVQAGIQARGGLVQEEQRRLGQQFQRDVDPFLLAA